MSPRHKTLLEGERRSPALSCLLMASLVFPPSLLKLSNVNQMSIFDLFGKTETRMTQRNVGCQGDCLAEWIYNPVQQTKFDVLKDGLWSDHMLAGAKGSCLHSMGLSARMIW